MIGLFGSPVVSRRIMKPFNLQEALAGKPVVTRDGRKVTDIHHFPGGSNYTIAAVTDRGDLLTFASTGEFNGLNHIPNSQDLFMASDKKEGWINLYPVKYGPPIRGAIFHDTEQDARKHASSDLITTIRIEWEE
jgi:hypothetical protein